MGILLVDFLHRIAFGAVTVLALFGLAWAAIPRRATLTARRPNGR